ncbi:MAG: HEPN domain-containing protein [Ignavibacteriae bacterium]|nr:HEPN domain-containing protein [Ignavibacteriota bacterium]
MATEQNITEARRWFRQAEDDLSAARILSANQKFAQACFLCQQSGEKALKAIWYWLDKDPWGHSIVKLIEDLDHKTIRSNLLQLRDRAVNLDRLYIPTRYPNGLPELVPLEAFSASDSDLAEKGVREILEAAKEILKL